MAPRWWEAWRKPAAGRDETPLVERVNGFWAEMAEVWPANYTPTDRQRDFVAVFDGRGNKAQCRRVLWSILNECGLMAPSADDRRPDFADSHRTYWNEGKRAVGRWLMAVVMGAGADAGSPESAETKRSESQ